MHTLGTRILLGAVAGAAATIVMSAQMAAPPSTARIGTLPPRRITRFLLPHASTREQSIAATPLHLAIGAVSGSLYRGLVRKRRGGILSGMVFGAAIWAIGYQIVVPLVSDLPPASRDAPTRRAALLEAHLVYGAMLGALS